MKRKQLQHLCVLVTVCQVFYPVQSVQAMETEKTKSTTSTVVINEIESKDADGGNDWVEIINTGTEPVDISGWLVVDSEGLDRIPVEDEDVDEDEQTATPSGAEQTATPSGAGKGEEFAYPLADDTELKPGEILVLEQGRDFDFGLGGADKVVLYDADLEIMDQYSWSKHAKGTYARVPDGTGEFKDQAPTKGSRNGDAGDIPVSEIDGGNSADTLVINEVNSSPDDWVELMNVGTEDMVLTGFELRDNSDDHRWKFPEGWKLEAGGLLLVKANSKGLIFNDTLGQFVEGLFDEAIGIGSGDSIRLYNAEGTLLDSHSWTEHANVGGDESASWGRYPDGKGSFVLMPETPGKRNQWYAPQIVINEVESNGDDTDWVEIYNKGSAPVDISGWYLLDNDPEGHKIDVTPVADGTGDFTDFETPTKGKANVVVNPVVINEVQSNDPAGGPDWIELANPTDTELDISGIIIKDDNDTHAYEIPDGTVIPAGGFIVFDENTFGFGLGKGDQVRLFENGLLIASTTWPEHTNPTWGLYPDVNGTKYQNTAEPTPGAANLFADIPDQIPWPGSGEVVIYDKEPTFLGDSSGLDFHDGKLYAVDNGTGKFWILDVEKDGTMRFAEGFEHGKTVNFKSHTSTKGPDTEGITVDGEGYIYLASERDNSEKGINSNVILKANPNEEDTALTAMQEWDLTASLPQVAANTGIEAVEWVSNDDVEGKLFDQNTGDVFDAGNYPKGVADGVFFVALEDNGHVYAYVLNDDESFVQIADIDPKLGGAMALNYDAYEGTLWVVTDDGFGNVAAKVTFTGEKAPKVVHIAPPEGLDATKNNEGFAIADADYTREGQRPVYRFQDCVDSGALSIGSIDCDYAEEENHTHSFQNGKCTVCGAVDPDYVNPDPINPDPINPDPVNPDPVNPGPVNPGKPSSGGSDSLGGSSVTDSQTAGNWLQTAEGWWYRLKDGSYPKSSWQQLSYNGKAEWYHFDENGYMQIGWLTDSDGHRYYLNPVSDGTKGKMLTGWNLIDGKWYYFNPVSDGTRGALFVNRETPDGYRVDENGVWIP